MTKQLAEKYEESLYKNLPDLEEIMSMVKRIDKPELVQQKGIFEVFRLIAVEEDIENEDDIESVSLSRSSADEERAKQAGKNMVDAFNKFKMQDERQ